MSSAPTSSVKATKKSAFSCDTCRKRKVRCDGQQPVCRRCAIRNDTCLYKLSPTLSYTERLESRVKELEHQLSQFQESRQSSENASNGTKDEASPAPVASPDESTSSDRTRAFKGLRIDDRGAITYHGTTSFFQLPTPSQDSSAEVAVSETSDPSSESMGRRERLVKNAWEQRVLETSAETPEPFQYLLRAHWCWIQPLFNFVYRPAFTRDMEVLGPYYSHTLLNAMLSHSVRWCKNDAKISHLLVQYESGQLFYRQARTLLFNEIRQGHSSVPTVQTLLLLSAQECGAGNRTQAWLYSGMAFRLIEDMGICIDGQRYAGNVRLSDEDIEIRHRLFWSCYFWDKMISLYLGRSPTLQHSSVSPPQVMLDDSAETELWTPHGVVYPNDVEYPPTQAHSISCFTRMCRLSEIFNRILVAMYDPLGRNTETDIQNCVSIEGPALNAWWSELPDFLRIEAKSLPPHCPPSHIVTLNCLYHTFKILLYRPMLFQRSPGSRKQHGLDPNHLVECISSATSIIAIFDLFCRTFGHRYCILSLSYSVYTAASIFLLQIQAAVSHDDQTLNRLAFCLNSLERVKSSNLVIGSSLGLITEALSKLGINLSKQASSQVSMSPNYQDDTRSVTQISDYAQSSHPPSTLKDHIDPQLLQGCSLDGFEVSSEMLEAFSNLEPMDPTFSSFQEWS
ncbi:related to pathway-specific regulatory protein nit-4 [Phialocephala subalpina]|uniref:Related to pathway-specific regulatory protein nit-4 n=1 Tax=Phialocephala subalpina TaxID=576137 RepID=A0A1L7WMR7_9HELO|nr:related to pathway-specific regulatory protein nit-4 [Phialocephala subalpina]